MRVFKNFGIFVALIIGAWFVLGSHPVLATTNKTLGSYDTAGNASDVTVVDNYAYVADGSDGVVVLDVSNPASPTLVGQYDTPGTAVQLEASGTALFVADTTSLQILNISTPTTPTLLGSYTQSGLTVNDVTTDGTYAYIVGQLSGVNKLELIRVTNVSSPTLSNSISLNASTTVALSGTTAYVAGGNYLEIVNTSPTLSLAGEYIGGSGNTFTGIQIQGSYAYLNDSTAGLQAILVANPASPTLSSGSTSAGSGLGGGVASSNGYIFLNNASGGLAIYDIIASPSTPVYVDTYTSSAIGNNVAIADTTAVVASGAAGVELLDVSKPDNVPPVITLTGPGGSGGVPPVITIGGKYTDPGASAFDNIDGSLHVTTINGLDLTTVGKYTITYTVTDRAGNTTTVTRTVIIAPAIITITGKSGLFTQTVNGRKIAMRPFSGYGGTIVARKLVVHKLTDPYFIFLTASATSAPKIVVYNYKGVVTSRVDLSKFTTKGLGIGLVSDPSTLAVMVAINPVAAGTTARTYLISKNGFRSSGNVTVASKASAMIVKLLKLYPDEYGVATMVKNKTSTIRIWRYSSSKKVFVRDTNYDLTKLVLTGTSIKTN